MKVFLAGATGFLGTYLCKRLVRQGHEVTLLARTAARIDRISGNIRIVRGDPVVPGEWQRLLPAHEVVINLTGASIFQPWTENVKRAIYESRIRSTENIVKAMIGGRENGIGRKHLFNASGVGYYGNRDDGPIDEKGAPGDTFLAHLAELWESAALKAEGPDIRVVLCRFGIVLGREGGAFPRMLPLARYRLGAPWGTGGQWISWIHEEDVAGIFSFLLDHQDIDGPINFTSPNPVRNSEMMAALNRILRKKPLIPSIRAWLFRSVLGEFSHVFLGGQRAVPARVMEKGFAFHFPTLEEAITDLTAQLKGEAPEHTLPSE